MTAQQARLLFRRSCARDASRRRELFARARSEFDSGDSLTSVVVVSVSCDRPIRPGEMTQQSRRRSRRARLTSVTAGIALVGIAGGGSSSAHAQGRAADALPQRLTIPYLANKTKPADLDFTAAQCDVASNGEQMTCRFRQVFLTIASFDATTCVITTNGYESILRRETNVRWVGETAPTGDCGVVETTVLDDGGGTHWTMTIRTAATRRTDQPECRAAPREVEVYDWLGVRRKLPCTSIQPGAIER
jgi:hypothetical protein